MKLSIIIPVFNEEKTILPVLEKVNKVVIDDVRKQIIVVNDGSTDKTINKIKNFATKNPNIEIINHSKNQGKGAAVISGIKNATGDFIVIQDADLEYNPEDIGKLVKLVQDKKTQVVYGTRLNRLPSFSRDERTPQFLLHYIGNKFLSFLTSMLYGEWITDMETCYKLFSKKSIDGINLKAKGFELEPEITAKLMRKGYKILEVPISTNPRGYSEGKKLNTVRDGLIAFWTLLKYRIVD